MWFDPALTAVLDIDPDNATVIKAGRDDTPNVKSFKITSLFPSGLKVYLLKYCHDPSALEMVEGEHASLQAIHDAVPTLCPRPHCHGTFVFLPDASFLVTDPVDELRNIAQCPGYRRNSNVSLASKLASLHSTRAPIPEGFTVPQFGFPVPTYCGTTLQCNTYTDSWAQFFALHRLRFVMVQSVYKNGLDAELENLVDRTRREVVPRLLGDAHLQRAASAGGGPITPVLVHGNMWYRNVGVARLPGMADGQAEAVAFNSAACYAHSEYELGIMMMFGGYRRGFMEEYHALVPKDEPVAEYESRQELYGVYYHLNHYVIYGAGYRASAVMMMRSLLGRFGMQREL